MKPPHLKGLLLAGGQSRRMGQDKALLAYDGGRTQLERTAAVLQAVGLPTFISLHPDQDYTLPPGVAAIHDSIEGAGGPLAGVLSAMAAHPGSDWLVLAVDLPFLEAAALEKLIAAHYSSEPRPDFTAYRSSGDGLPEPLCALYSASAEPLLRREVLEAGRFCPRRIMIDHQAPLIDLDQPHWLDNANTPEDRDRFLARLQ